MFLQLILYLFYIVVTRTCQSGEFLYQSFCIPQSCLFDKLSRVQLTPLNNYDTNTGNLNLQMGIVFQEITETTMSGTQFDVTIQYGDIFTNQLVSDPINCIDWRLYQTKNTYYINPTRKFVNSSDQMWPQATYSYNQKSQAGQIQFIVSQADLDTRQCLHFSGSQADQWECFFELAFLIKQQTQASYYFSFKVMVDTQNSNQLPSVNYGQMIHIDGCQNDQISSNGQCLTQKKIKSSLQFCKTSSCNETSSSSFFVLYVDRAFWLKHQIDDPLFYNYTIDNVSLTYQAFGFNLQLKPSDVNVLVHGPGYNIYELQAHIISENLLISTYQTLSSQVAQSFLQPQDTTQYMGLDQINSGQIYSTPVLAQSAVQTQN